jgi:hypothetical protein
VLTVFGTLRRVSLVEVDRRFRGAYCLHHQGDCPEADGCRKVGIFLRDHTAQYPGKLSCTGRVVGRYEVATDFEPNLERIMDQ